ITVRLAMRRFAGRLRASGAAAARVLIVGNGDAGDRLASALAEETLFGITVVARLPVETLVRPPGSMLFALGESDAPLEHRSVAAIGDLLRSEAIDEVAVATGLGAGEIEALLEACDREGVALHVAVEALGAGLERAHFSEIADAKLLSVNPQRHSAWGRAV